MKYDVVKLKNTNEVGIVMIPEKNCASDSYSLNIILIVDDSRYVAAFDESFEKIGEIDINDKESK